MSFNFAAPVWRRYVARAVSQLRLAPDDLLRDATYRRLWTSILISSFGGQVTMLALPLTAAVLLHATPTQMGLLTAMEVAPFVLFSLPSGVWLDRVRKLPVYVIGESLLALIVASVPLAWWLGWLSMMWLYIVGFAIGTVATIAGSAAQIVLTQVVARERLVEAHAKNALAHSSAEVAGPGAAGVLIKLVGAPIALLADAVLLAVSAAILRGIQVQEGAQLAAARFWPAMRAGLVFVTQHRLLVTMACIVGVWQMCHHAALVVQILFATRTLGLSEGAVGLCFCWARRRHDCRQHRRQSHFAPLRPRPDTGARRGDLRCRLVARRNRAGLCGRNCDVCGDVDDVRRRRGADLHHVPRDAAGGHARAAAGPHDQHDALVDIASCRAGCAARWMAGRARRIARGAGVCGRRCTALAALAWRQPVIRNTRVLPSVEALPVDTVPDAA